MSYNKKTWVSKETITKEALNNIEEGIATLDENQENFATKEEIPSIEGLATEEYVDEEIAKVSIDIDYDSLLAFDTNEIITNPNYVDSDNTIILDDDLPAGTYTLKYEFKDGTYTDIKNFIIGNESVNLMKESEIYLNQRYSLTNGGFITQPGVFSLITPFTNINNDTMVLSFSNLKYTLLATNSTLYILDNNKSNPLTVNGDCDFMDMSSGVEVSYSGLSGTVTFVPPINEGYLAISVRIKDDGTEIAATDFENYIITLTTVKEGEDN